VTTGRTPPAAAQRHSGEATRAAIQEVAAPLFIEHGFNGVSVRTIAAAAHVDPALVIRHFGSKEALFLRTIDPEGGLSDVMSGPLETLGRRLVEHFVGKSGTHLRQSYVALVQASDRPSVREELIRSNAANFVGPLAARLAGERAPLRAALAAAQVGGLLTSLFLAQDPVLGAADEADVVELYGDAIQQLLTP
jgi:AcrR family transcriptional regulator